MSRVSVVHPVLLLLYPFPQHLFTVKPLRDVVAEGPIQTGVTMKSLTIMTAEEMEIVEPLVSATDTTLPALLERKASQTVDRDTSLKNFLLNSGIAAAHENQNMRQLYDERLKSAELRNALHELFVLDDDPDTDSG